MGIALKVSDLDEDSLESLQHESVSEAKECSGCDPDVPGHSDRASCPICRGTGRESLSFAATFLEISQSHREEQNPKKYYGSSDYGDDSEDDVQDFDY